MPLIDIILPTFNHRRFLDRIVKCVFKQEFTDFKCYIVNDGSTDGTSEYLNDVAAADSRITVLSHVQNRGLPAALNTGHAAGSSPYCTWYSDDNYYFIDHLKCLFQCITSNDADFVQSFYTTVEPAGRFLRDIRQYRDNWGMANLCPSFLYRRTIWERFKYDEELQCLEDLKFYLQAYLADYKFDFVEKNLVEYFVQDDSLTKKIVWKDLAAHNEKLEKLYNTTIKPALDEKALRSSQTKTDKLHSP